MNRLLKNPITYFLVIIVAIWVVASVLKQGAGPKHLDYGTFKTKLESGQVDSVVAFKNGGKLEGELTDGTKFRSEFGSLDKLEEAFDKAGKSEILQFKNDTPSFWGNLIGSILPFIIIIGIFLFLMQQMQGGGNRVMSFGKAKAKVVSKDQPKITFGDVAGVDEAIEELEEIKEFLENP
ncbi:MAG TPA: ATP-dependent metallopeptidase FtsH/Yme1/Tma family protein, partial [Actinomycetota bacterium]|nr:ATP-dependent metallopeptidase FtsH/Yme1/Tma family protein [Actinomycetota bacterium]